MPPDVLSVAEVGSVEELRELRQRLGTADYIAYCRTWSAERGLPSNAIRAIVWRDLVLGCGECEAVPQLSESIIRHTSRLTESSLTNERSGRHTKRGSNNSSSTSVVDAASSSSSSGKCAVHSVTSAQGELPDRVQRGRQSWKTMQKEEVAKDEQKPFSLDFARVHSGSLTTLATSTTTTNTTTSPSSAEPTPRLVGTHTEVASSPTTLSADNEVDSNTIQRGRSGRSAVRATSVPLPRHRKVSCSSDVYNRRLSAKDGTPCDASAHTSLLFSPLTQHETPTAHNKAPSQGTRAHSQPGSLREGSCIVGGVMQAHRLPENCKPRVVHADVERALWGLYPEVTERARMRGRLRRMLLRILASHPHEQFYYQGLHELMGFVLYVCTPYVSLDEVVAVCEGLLRQQWARFATPTLQPSQAMLYAMHRIIAAEDAPLATALETCGVGPESHYAVSWFITWYTHNLRHNGVLARLFDYFVAWPDELGVVFVSAALVLQAREQILTWIEAEVADIAAHDGDAVLIMAHVYSKMVHLPTLLLEPASETMLNELLARATALRDRHFAVAIAAQRQFLKGEVNKLGVLGSWQTRNAALRLLWRLLPREWRRFVEHKKDLTRLQRALLLGTVAAAVVALLCSRSGGVQTQLSHVVEEGTLMLSGTYKHLCNWLHPFIN